MSHGEWLDFYLGTRSVKFGESCDTVQASDDCGPHGRVNAFLPIKWRVSREINVSFLPALFKDLQAIPALFEFGRRSTGQYVERISAGDVEEKYDR